MHEKYSKKIFFLNLVLTHTYIAYMHAYIHAYIHTCIEKSRSSYDDMHLLGVKG